MRASRAPKLCLLVAPLLLVGSVAAADDTPDLSGDWKLDEGLSDDPIQRMREALIARGASGGTGTGSPWGGTNPGSGPTTTRGVPGSGGTPVPQYPGGSVPGSTGPGSAGAPGSVPGTGSVPAVPGTGGSGPTVITVGRNPASPEEMLERLVAMQESRRRIEITHEEPDFILLYADGESLELFTDGIATPVETPSGLARVTAKWKKDKLVVRTQGDKVATTEVYKLNKEGDELTITTRLEMGATGTMSFKQLYRQGSLVEKATLVNPH